MDEKYYTIHITGKDTAIKKCRFIADLLKIERSETITLKATPNQTKSLKELMEINKISYVKKSPDSLEVSGGE